MFLKFYYAKGKRSSFCRTFLDRRARCTGRYRAAILMAVSGAMVLGLPKEGSGEIGQPKGCLHNCVHVITQVIVPTAPDPNIGVAQHDDAICFIATLDNTGQPNQVCCDVTDINLSFVFPDGSTALYTLPNQTLAANEIIQCPGPFPQCAQQAPDAPCPAGFLYEPGALFMHGDERGDQVGVPQCPPITDQAEDFGFLYGWTFGGGVAQQPNPGAAGMIKCLSVDVPHGACCQPCTGVCVDEVSEGECQPPMVFHAGMTCDEADCQPLVCGKCETCVSISDVLKGCVKNVPGCCASDDQCPGKCDSCDLGTNTCFKRPGCCSSDAQCPGKCDSCDPGSNTCFKREDCCTSDAQCPEKCGSCDTVSNTCLKREGCCASDAQCPGKCDSCDPLSNTCFKRAGCCTSQAQCAGCEDCVNNVCVDDQAKCPGCQDCVSAVCVDSQAKCPGCQDCVNAVCEDSQAKCVGCEDCVNGACVDSQAKCIGCEDCVNGTCVDNQAKCIGCEDCVNGTCVDNQGKCIGCEDCEGGICVDSQAKCPECEDCQGGICVADPSKCAGCLTRTPGFWGTHPHITALFLPLGNCGLTVDNTDPATPVSATEDMCFGGRDFRGVTSPQQLQLIRQCMAAQLNVAASVSGDGVCTTFPFDSTTIDVGALLGECCDDLCTSGATGQAISESTCIDRLDAFNNSDDTLDPFGPFVRPGPAQSESCREANGNSWVNPGRNLAPLESQGKWQSSEFRIGDR